MEKRLRLEFNENTKIEETDIENICMIVAAFDMGGKLTPPLQATLLRSMENSLDSISPHSI